MACIAIETIKDTELHLILLITKYERQKNPFFFLNLKSKKALHKFCTYIFESLLNTLGNFKNCGKMFIPSFISD